jgi:hypothetical protein
VISTKPFWPIPSRAWRVTIGERKLRIVGDNMSCKKKLSEERRGGEVRVKEVMGREESETALLGGQMKIFIKTIGSIGRS